MLNAFYPESEVCVNWISFVAGRKTGTNSNIRNRVFRKNSMVRDKYIPRSQGIRNQKRMC
jgi:hypothetical protein